ncbi:MAG: HNH endonuclease [Pseudonocardia sp.]|nr:HNH endonuclease [Pseudonocardia sp.]
MKRAYRQANRDAIRALNNRRKALQRDIEVNDLTPQQWVAIVKSYAGQCVYCGCVPDRITMDHVVPLSKDGGHTASNVVPACGPCNSAKGDRPAPPFVIQPAT